MSRGVFLQVPTGVPFEEDFPAGVVFPGEEDGRWPARVAPLVMEEEGWEDLVADMPLLELYG